MNNRKLQPELKSTVNGLTVDEIELKTNSVDDIYAAVDLGSNSFHLVISRYQHGEFVVLDRQREVVRLAAGLDSSNKLSKKVAERALQSLEKFGQLLRNFPPEQVRVVGTNALRRLKEKNRFLDRAEKALGHSIEIIAGREEARLIYLGVSKWSALADESRLVIDIGGGSTEIIVGKSDVPTARESIEMGCVVFSRKFFKDGVLSAERFEQAKLAAKLELQPVIRQFRLAGWNKVMGCSGTMKSLALAVNQKDVANGIIRRADLEPLLKRVVEIGHIDELDLPGLTKDRQPVFAGGFAILLALFEEFDIAQMSVSDIALREGVLYDLVGRSSAEDIRDVTVNAMLNRWDVDIQQSSRVKETALGMYDLVANEWDIHDTLFHKMLGWSSLLHEIGLLISHDSYHKHGAYLVANADMAGFTKRDQLLLSALIAGHRQKFPVYQFENLPSGLVTPAKRVATILRLAVLLHRGRGSFVLGNVDPEVVGQQIRLKFDDNYLRHHPLTRADLEQERSRLKTIGIKLKFK